MRSFSLALPCSKSIVHLTSPAVNGLPSCQFTPWRNGKVSSVPSSFHAQPVARSGTIDRSVFCGTRWSNMTRLLKTPIIGRLTASVDSSSIDMLAGLSKWPIFRIPPCFCADAVPVHNNSAPAVASTRRSRFIAICLLFISAGLLARHRNLPAHLSSSDAGSDDAEAITFRETGTSRVSPARGVPCASNDLTGDRRMSSLVEPEVFEALAVVDAVDHEAKPP